MARGTVCYVRSILPDAIVVCNTVIAKCHIAGSGKNTIPRMKLEAALDSIHLSRLVKQELDLLECPCFFGRIRPLYYIALSLVYTEAVPG